MSGGGMGRVELVGRRAELAHIGELLDGLREGRGGALRIDGEPGVGKSALLEAAVPDDLLCLRATGVEIELELPLAALDELLAGLPGGESDRGQADPAERLLEAAGLIERSAPLLILADDLQWMDPSSRGAIAYLARRAPQLGIGLIGVWSLRGQLPDEWPGVDVMPLGELPRADAFELARRQGLADPVAESIVSAVGGNPLALIEAPAGFAAGQRLGRQMLPDPAPVGASLQATYEKRLAELDEDALDALLLAAAGAPAELVAARLGPAEDAGLVRLGGGYEFAHPLIRSAVYHSAAPSSRREAHRRIAASSEDPERTRQLALAAEGPDEELAAGLERLAGEAAQAGAPGTAASMLERSVSLSVDQGRKAGRGLAGAHMALIAGRPETALGLLDLVEGDEARAGAQLLRGAAVYLAGRPGDARTLLEKEAARVEAENPGLASALLTQACVAVMAPGPMGDLELLAGRALDLAPAGGEAMPAVTLASALAVLGRVDEARSLLEEHEPFLAGLDPTGPGHEILGVVGFCLLWLGEIREAIAWLTRLIGSVREVGADSVLAGPLAIQAAAQLRAGRLDEAVDAAGEALEIVETGFGMFGLTLALSSAGLVAAARGDEDACRSFAERMFDLGERSGLTLTLAAAEQSLGLLDLSLGNGEDAARHLERAAGHLERYGVVNPILLLTDADLIEALVRSGRGEEAAPALERLERGAEMTGGRWAVSAVERCRGLLGPADEIEERLASSLDALGAGYMPLEEARTRLALGERLRRERHRSAARRELGQARESFERMGAALWADRAAKELAATQGPSSEELTSRERDVCDLVAGGSTNREVAAKLFVSPRTVEHHLRSAYRKLGIRSRSELAARWRD